MYKRQVYHIGQGLKGIKGNSDGQRRLDERNAPAGQPVQAIHQKTGVLEKAQQPQVYRQCGGQQAPAQRLGGGPAKGQDVYKRQLLSRPISAI